MGSSIFISPGSGQPNYTEQEPTPPAASYNGEDIQEPLSTPLDAGEIGVQSRTPEELTKFLDLAAKRFRGTAAAESEQRQLAIRDIEFRIGENHWPAAIKAARMREGRPCLTINRIPQFIRQVTNDERQNRPSIHVTAKGEKASSEVADVLEGLIRSIEQDNGDIAYDTAFDHAASTGGPGYIRILTEYEDDTTFNQKLMLKRVLNPFPIYLDPYYEEPDGSDAEWGFVVQDMPKQDYIDKYGIEDAASLTNFQSICAASFLCRLDHGREYQDC